jgi:hypothetical protein
LPRRVSCEAIFKERGAVKAGFEAKGVRCKSGLAGQEFQLSNRLQFCFHTGLALSIFGSILFLEMASHRLD